MDQNAFVVKTLTKKNTSLLVTVPARLGELTGRPSGQKARPQRHRGQRHGLYGDRFFTVS